MLLEIAIELAELQVVEDQGPPSSHSLGVFFCTFCRTRLHGHGWRKRYYITDSLSSLQLWIHRKLCPCCRKTYTLLPVWVHAFKLFSLETICRILACRIEKGHFSTILGISGYLQRRWWKGYSDRSRCESDFPDHGLLFSHLKSTLRGCLAAPPSVNIVQNRGLSLMGLKLRYHSHQRLYLYVPRCIP